MIKKILVGTDIDISSTKHNLSLVPFLSNVSTPFPDGHYGQGVGGVVVSGLACTGEEASLAQCPGTWGTSVSHSMCDHRSDAGVNCGSKCLQYNLSSCIMNVIKDTACLFLMMKTHSVNRTFSFLCPWEGYHYNYRTLIAVF